MKRSMVNSFALIISSTSVILSCQTAQVKMEQKKPSTPQHEKVIFIKENGNYKEFSSTMITLFLRQNYSLNAFYQDLFDVDPRGYSLWENSEEIPSHREERVITYLLNEYPVIMPGSKGKLAHHHSFVIKDETKKELLKSKIYEDQETYNSYKFHITDLTYFSTAGYDNIRYIWWNPYVENYNDPRSFPGNTQGFLAKAAISEYGKVLILTYFKTTFVRTPENIRRLYDRFKVTIFNTVKKNLYESLGIKQTVDTLLEGYDYFLKKDPETFCRILQTRYYGKAENPSSTAECVGAYNSYWYYGFWERRYSEKNIDSVITILKEIQDHYRMQ